VKKIILKASRFLGIILARTRKSYISGFMIENFEAARSRYMNVNFDSKTNGEYYYLKKLSAIKFPVLFDVGANIGEWSLMVGTLWPESKIYSFEILPMHWETLAANTSKLINVNIIKSGLSDSEGMMKLFFNSRTGKDPEASSYPQFLMKSEKEHYDSEIDCSVITGASFVKEHEINKIDVLKVDVEGHDLKVIKGFGDFINNVRCIQFEYGVYNITSKDLLIDFYSYMQKYNFIIGRLYPHYVDFSEFTYSRENFLGGNYIAVKHDDDLLISLLKDF
jgi:FkbM family methyltransferase